MKGALLELAARGTEDLNLIGNPNMTFFKGVHKRHTNFTKFEQKNVFYGEPAFGTKNVCKVERYGDLLTKIWLQVKLSGTGNSLVSWIKSVGNYMIKEVKLKMGGEVIAKISGEYIDIYHKYYFGVGHYNTYSAGVRNIQGHTNTSLSTEQVVLVPLPFWFGKDISQAIPLISLQYTTIEVEIEFRPLTDLLYSGGDKSNLGNLVDLSSIRMTECFLYGEYIYLDKEERIEFAKKENFEYLIEQVQEKTYIVEQNTKQKTYKLDFNLPSKEILWFYRSNDYEAINRWHLYNHIDDTNNNRFAEPLTDVSLSLNGNDRVDKRVAQYFRIIVPLYCHNSSNNDLIYFYNFALDCDTNQPSGSLNFSKIDDSRLNIEWSKLGSNGIKTGTIFILCVNYNFLKIKKGMAGILYQ
jgi:hypothetical protein